MAEYGPEENEDSGNLFALHRPQKPKGRPLSVVRDSSFIIVFAITLKIWRFSS
jgi:hypothetical protein